MTRSTILLCGLGLCITHCVSPPTAEAQNTGQYTEPQAAIADTPTGDFVGGSLFSDETPPIQPTGHDATVAGSLDEACPDCDQPGGSLFGAHSCCDDFWTRQSLTNGFFGTQPALAQQGIVYDALLTQFYQGVTRGGVDETFKYGGKLDQFLILNSDQLGLWQGMQMIMHAETRFGEDVILDAVGLAPVNVNMVYPTLENQTAITGLQFIQGLSEEWAVTFGKFNSLDLFHMLYPQTGRGVEGFMNASVIMPLTVTRSIPLSFLGAGVMKMRDQQIEGSVIVADTNNTPTTSGFDDLFDNGATIVGLWRLFTECNELPGSHMFLGTWASGDFTSLDPLNWAFIPGQGIVAGEETGSWSLFYLLEQKLWVDPCKENRSVGLLSQWGLADEETSPYGWIGNVSLQGQGLISCREQDTMGVGYFYSGLSEDFKDLVSVIGVDDLQGVELYYNAAITPWFRVTADLQVVEPALEANDTAIVFGLRASMRL